MTATDLVLVDSGRRAPSFFTMATLCATASRAVACIIKYLLTFSVQGFSKAVQGCSRLFKAVQGCPRLF